MEKMNEKARLVMSIENGVTIEGPADEVRRIAYLLETVHRPVTQEAVAQAMAAVLNPLIGAANDGKIIQYRVRRHGSEWSDCVRRKHIAADFDLARNEYRVKPEPREVWVRLDGPAPAVYLDEDMDEATAQGLGYVRMREVVQE